MTKLKTLLPSPSRLAAYLTALSGLAGAVAVPVANLDTTSTAGVALGVAGVCSAYATWAKGRREHEQAVRLDSLAGVGERVPRAVVRVDPVRSAPETAASNAPRDSNPVYVRSAPPRPGEYVNEAPDPEGGPQLVEIPDPLAAAVAGVATVFVPLESLTRVVQSPTAAGPRAVNPS